jgi:hypothetical protein
VVNLLWHHLATIDAESTRSAGHAGNDAGCAAENEALFACWMGPHRAAGHWTNLSNGTDDFTPPTTTEPSRQNSRKVSRCAKVPQADTLALDENHGQAIW